jgi:uncharacterized membrane protein YfcA
VILPVLIPAALLASALSGMLGMGGGVVLLAVMASILPVAEVVPVHGVVQLTSNFSRTLALLPRVCWRIVALYAPGMVLGVVAGIRITGGEGLPGFKPAIGAFVLAFLLWDRFKPKRIVVPRWVFLPAGLVGGLLTVTLGATGPFLAAFFLRDDLERREIVATKAAIQSFGHLLKIPAFLSVGFDYVPRLQWIAPLLLCVIAGTWIGTRLLGRMPDALFRKMFRVVLALMALRLLAPVVTGG